MIDDDRFSGVPRVLDVAKVPMSEFEREQHVHDSITGLCLKDRAGTCRGRKVKR